MEIMKSRTITSLIILISVILGGCASVKTEISRENEKTVETYTLDSVNKAQPGALSGKRKLSYIRGTWELPEGRYWRAEEIRGDLLTDLNVCFALIDTEGKVYLSNRNYLKNQISTLRKMFPNLRVNVSIGGWEAEGFCDAASTAENRWIFTESVIELVKEMDFTGVDIDWEFPVGSDWGQNIKCSPADRENFVLLLSDLRGALDTLGDEAGYYYSLSAAIPSNSWFNKKNDVYAASLICDYLNLMCYDYYGSWSETTGHNASLYLSAKDSYGWCSEMGVKSCLAAGIDPEKIVMGIPFYSFAWTGVEEGNNHGLYGKTHGYIGPISYKNLDNFADGFEEYWDETARYSYRYNRQEKIFLDHISPRMIQEITSYALEKNLGGLMYWEYAHDMDAVLLSCLSGRFK